MGSLSEIQDREVTFTNVSHAEKATPFDLVVSEVQPKDWGDLAVTIQEWFDLAHARYLRIHNGAYPKFDDISLDKGRIFRSSKNITLDIFSNLLLPPGQRIPGSDAWDSVFICQDGAKKIHAIALYSQEENFLGYIASHPDNLKHELNAATRVRGAAIKLMLHMFQKTLDNESTLRLRSVKSARSFYQELKFEEDLENYTDEDREEGFTPMKLTANKIRELINSKQSPFNDLTLK